MTTMHPITAPGPVLTALTVLVGLPATLVGAQQGHEPGELLWSHDTEG